MTQNTSSTTTMTSTHLEPTSVTPEVEATLETEVELPIRRFDPDSIKNYPRSNRKVSINYGVYSLTSESRDLLQGQSIHISPDGLEFLTSSALHEGTLLKVQINIPDYWNRKARFVEYRRIDRPQNFSILVKIVKTEDIGKRGKKKIITAQTVNIDETDEMVLKSYLQEG